MFRFHPLYVRATLGGGSTCPGPDSEQHPVRRPQYSAPAGGVEPPHPPSQGGVRNPSERVWSPQKESNLLNRGRSPVPAVRRWGREKTLAASPPLTGGRERLHIQWRAECHGSHPSRAMVETGGIEPPCSERNYIVIRPFPVTGWVLHCMSSFRLSASSTTGVPRTVFPVRQSLLLLPGCRVEAPLLTLVSAVCRLGHLFRR